MHQSMSYLDYICNSFKFSLVDDPKPTHSEPVVNLVVEIFIIRIVFVVHSVLI